MRLPAYTGKYQVTCIDLEIPAREPRYFASGVVEATKLNNRKKFKKENKSDRKGKQTDSEENREGTQQAKVKVTHKDDVDHSRKAQVGRQNEDGENEEEQFDPFRSKKSTSTLHFDTTLFTIYAPSSVTKEEAKHYSKGAWMGRPKGKGMSAFFKYVGQYGPFAIPASPALLSLANASFPCLVGAPLAETQSPFPVIIFSHGLAGNRLSYSQFCGELASHGVIVAAIEHRDGSGIASVVRHVDRNSKTTEPQAKTKTSESGGHPKKAAVPYLVFEQVGLRSFAPDASEEELALRGAQLAMRKAEILECKHILERINSGEGAEVARESTRKLGTKLAEKKFKLKESSQNLNEHPELLSTWKDKLYMSFPSLVGHSFGGCTVLETLKGDSPFPLGIALDPWVEPLLTQKELEKRSNSNTAEHKSKDGNLDFEFKNDKKGEDDQKVSQTQAPTAPIYVFNSEGFTIWSEHFNKLQTILSEARAANGENKGWLFTLAGCHHLDFSDYPFLLPHIFRSTVGPHKTVAIFSKATFIQFSLSRKRANEAKAKQEIDGNKAEEDVIRRDTVDSGGKVAEEKKSEIRERIAKERQARIAEGYRGVIAERNASGNALIGRRRTTGDSIEFAEHAEDVGADPDAEEVHKQLQDISDSLHYKKNKIHSLMSLTFHWSGVDPGLERPGKVLIHR